MQLFSRPLLVLSILICTIVFNSTNSFGKLLKKAVESSKANETVLFNDLKKRANEIFLNDPNPASSSENSVKIEKPRLAALRYLEQNKLLLKSSVLLKELSAQKQLIANQFLDSESFQAFQNAKGLSIVEKWTECLKELDEIKLYDQDNFEVLKLRAYCAFENGQLEISKKIYDDIFVLIPKDPDAILGQMKAALVEKNYPSVIKSADSVDFLISWQVEQKNILKAQAYYGLGKITEAFDVLETDYSKNRNHILSIYWLGLFYHKENFSIQSSKYFTLFEQKIKNFDLEDPKFKKFREAKNEIERIQQKLKIETQNPTT